MNGVTAQSQDGHGRSPMSRRTSRRSPKSPKQETASGMPSSGGKPRRSSSTKKLRRRASKRTPDSAALPANETPPSIPGSSEAVAQERGEDEAAELVRQLMSLQLPHMPNTHDINATTNPPTIRILVVADIDLESATALAESSLMASSAAAMTVETGVAEVATMGATKLLNDVDLCIACGPFCRDVDLEQYYRGRQQKRYLARQQHKLNHAQFAPNEFVPDYAAAANSSGIGVNSHGAHGYTNVNTVRYHQHGNRLRSRTRPLPASNHARHAQHQPSPYSSDQTSDQNRAASGNSSKFNDRTREENAALEGLMTAALAQLESIVCRVVYVPGKADPTTSPFRSSEIRTSSTSFLHASSSSFAPSQDGSLNSSSFHRKTRSSPLHSTSDSTKRERRLTPNSCNIHKHWLPLCPGLGCGGLLYFDKHGLQNDPPPLEDEDDNEELHEDPGPYPYEIVPGSHADPGQSGRNGTLSHANGANSNISEAFCHEQDLEDRLKAHGEQFCESLEELVKLAPPLSPALPKRSAQNGGVLNTSLFQTILVSHFHHAEIDESDVEEQHDIKPDASGLSVLYDEEESFDPPWPTEHEAFCARPVVQEHVMLEVAAGLNSSGETVRPMELPKGKLRVVLPGSLRSRGEYCVVDLAFMKDPHHQKSTDYRWRVRETKFCTIDGPAH